MQHIIQHLRSRLGNLEVTPVEKREIFRAMSPKGVLSALSNSNGDKVDLFFARDGGGELLGGVLTTDAVEDFIAKL